MDEDRAMAMLSEPRPPRRRWVDACLVAGGMGIVAVAVLVLVLVSFVIWLPRA